MRLKKIKLGGFKSFVDPTTISFPSPLVGVVGPNGCGKSNVIDAVRWVMGESSAKHLRGDALTDVIFNGSAARKPVGHATIELVFDNSEGRLGGQYANYNEIAIKRQLSRDGQSVYFLNGTRCRRRDITDIFLGTGLGPRSYAIIEQGTISRLIEAKPEELRIFLEEAAGISKYKERRRETENRIRDAKENISRVDDLIIELEKRLQTLQRQAKTAERYKEVKEEERRRRAELLALRWRALDEEAGTRQREMAARDNELEAQVAGLRAIEADTEKQRDAHVEANDRFNRIQGDYYGVGAEIARIEQSIQHAREMRAQQQQDLEAVELAWNEQQSHMRQDRAQIDALNETLAASEPQLLEAERIEAVSAEALAAVERDYQAWQEAWDEFNAVAAAHGQRIEVERTRIAHLEAHLKQLHERRLRLEGEHQGLGASGVEEETASLNRQAADAHAAVERLRQELQILLQRLGQQRDHNRRGSDELDQERMRLQDLHTEQARLQALQSAALGQQEETVNAWLDEQGLKDERRLAQGITVENGWERAVELALGGALEAICVDGLDAITARLDSLRQGRLTVFDTAAPLAGDAGTLATPLRAKVQAPWDLTSLLTGIYAVETLSEALGLRSRLGVNESVVTRDGVWLGHDWLRIARASDDNSGILLREQELREVAQSVATVAQRVTDIERAVQDGGALLKALEDEREHLQARLDQATQYHAELRAQASSKDASLEQILVRRGKVTNEISEVTAQSASAEHEFEAARDRLREMQSESVGHEGQRDDLVRRRDELRALLEVRRDQVRRDRDSGREIHMRVETTRTQLQSLTAALERIARQMQTLERQRSELANSLAGGEAPIETMKGELDQLLARRLQVENGLAEARKSVEDCEQNLRTLNERRAAAEQTVDSLRAALDSMRMAWQEISVRRQTLEEQVQESGHTLETLLDELPEDAAVEAWQAQVEGLATKIQRMGPINLAAIDEYAEQSERKTYLDAQLADLNEALATLENAIRKIDSETRTRFKSTFELVNERLGELYPKLFGGGMARMEMTGDDLLEAGVVVMARPPGKRNSSIHQLSGGEKALTAVALVFAMFELNPAPFCMLDEVDAPLDDTNAARFCQLVKTMSDRVQFIFITHNKITMELAQQLIGVTMHEPGVSRPVAVDVDEAVQMAAS